MSYKQRQYKLLNLDNGKSIVLDGTKTNYIPRNWDESDYTIKVSTRNFSTTKVASDSLEFTGSGASFLRDAYDSKDIEAKVLFQEFRANPKTDVFETYDIALFDFAGFTDEINVVKLQFNSGSLASLIKSKQNDKFELERTTSINGEDIGELSKNDFAVVNRPIYLDSKSTTLKEDEETNPVFFDIFDQFTLSYSFPLSVEYESDNRFVSIIPNQSNSSPDTGINAGVFYNNSDVDKVLKIEFDTDYNIKVIKVINYFALSLSLNLSIYKDGESLNLKERIIINQFNSLQDGQIESVSAKYSNNNFTLLKGESLSIEWVFNNETQNVQFGAIRCVFKDIRSSLQITEESLRSDFPRRCKFILNKDAGERQLQILTGEKDRYYSEFFNTSDFKLTGITSGKLIRGFNDSNITTSMRDWLKNSNCLFNMGYNVEVINGVEKLVHEPLKHFFREETVIKLPRQVKVTKRYVARELTFNTIKSGYRKPSGDNLYEEVNGLNEYNTTNEYVAPITKIIQDYDIESPYRADSEGKELTIRKSITVAPTEDYRTDNNIFNLDLKDIGTGVYEERLWQDDYELEPKGVFNPSTSTGLRFTPFRNMERHFWLLNNAYQKQKEKYIRYSNTRGNSNLSTKKTGEEEKKENGDFKINNLENAIFVNQWVEFEYPLDFDTLKLINSKTNINGRDIPNTYFAIEFINEKNEKEKGFIFELKPNGVGKWKVLKSL